MADEKKRMLNGQEIDPNELHLLLRQKPPYFIAAEKKIKKKVGHGGLSEDTLNKAEMSIKEIDIDFKDMAQSYLDEITAALDLYKTDGNTLSDQDIIDRMIGPAMQLKANGTMFGHTLVTTIADPFVNHIEEVTTISGNDLKIIEDFIEAINDILTSGLQNAESTGYDPNDPLCSI